MRVKRMSKWLSESELKTYLNSESILQWLLEDGSITQKIAADGAFRLEVIKDGLGLASLEDYQAIDVFPQPIRIREVRLFRDDQAVVYAKSIIPFRTSRFGYPDLGAIGSKPLGELIFQSDLFIKQNCKFAKFSFEDKETVWGRRSNYLVNGYPFSIMEVFL